MPVREGIEDDLPANDDRMYVLEVSRVVLEIFEGNPLVPDGVCYTISEWSPFRPPSLGGKPREIAWGQRDSETEEGVFWGVVTRENTPRFGPTRVDVFPTRDEAIRYMEAVEPECPLHSLRGRSIRPRPSLSDYREWVAANGWAPSYVGPVPESDVGVHVLPSPFSIPGEWDDAIHWRMAPRGSRHMLESTIQSSIGSGQLQSPWAVIVLDHAYKLMGRFLATRGAASEILGFARNSPGGRPPPTPRIPGLAQGSLGRRSREMRTLPSRMGDARGCVGDRFLALSSAAASGRLDAPARGARCRAPRECQGHRDRRHLSAIVGFSLDCLAAVRAPISETSN